MMKLNSQLKSSLTLFLLYIITVNQTACSHLTKVPKPNPTGYFNFVGGYCISSTMNTLEAHIITPHECEEIKDGEGVFYPSDELKKLLAFGNKICDVSKMCSKDEQKAINDKFYQFLDQPEKFKELLKDKVKD